MRKKIWQAYLLIAPLLLGVAVFYAVPFGQVVQYSFRSGGGLGFENYRELLTNDAFTLAFSNSMKFFAAGLPLIMALSYLLALLLKAQAQRYKLLKSVFLFPYIMPVVGTVLLVELLQRTVLSAMPLFWVTILLYLWKNTGYAVILLLAGLVTIPEDQYESAELDGASSFQKFRFITTPQMWYPVFFALIFSVINGFKCFREIFLIGGEEPADGIYMLQHFVNNSFKSLNYRKLSVSSLLLFAVILAFFGALYIFVRRKERYRE